MKLGKPLPRSGARGRGELEQRQVEHGVRRRRAENRHGNGDACSRVSDRSREIAGESGCEEAAGPRWPEEAEEAEVNLALLRLRDSRPEDSQLIGPLGWSGVNVS